MSRSTSSPAGLRVVDISEVSERLRSGASSTVPSLASERVVDRCVGARGLSPAAPRRRKLLGACP
ncbi:hypothetical protein [Leucobacter albus]|uniref:FXSXX-COOH protein n=1 Tax=Leucobacter albus TaxID=272210 RepID=A0ABW3TRN8_9MICO